MDKETRKRVRELVRSRVPSNYFQWNTLPAGTANGTQVSDQRTVSRAPQVKPPKRKKGKRVQPSPRFETDGQPRFEGGFSWVQGGLPSLGKRR